MGVDKIQISVRFDQLFKTAVKNEETCRLKWKERYSAWLPGEYLKISNQLKEVSKQMEKKSVGLIEKRTLKPVPITSSGFYGWVAGKREFQTEIFGPDVMNTIPLRKESPLDEDYLI